jgi:hypothetical protein
MGPPFGPIAAGSTEVAAPRRGNQQVDSEFRQKAGGAFGDLPRFITQDDVVAGGEEVCDVHAQPAGQMVVADPCGAKDLGITYSGRYRGRLSRATAMMPSSISATFGDASRK